MYPYDTSPGAGLDTGGFLDGLTSLAAAAGSAYQQFNRPNGVATPNPGPAPVVRPALAGLSPWAIAAGVLALVALVVFAVKGR